jgi:hypothetical protein
MESTTVDQPVAAEKQEPVRCTYCSELAAGINASGMPVCGIPDNHPDADSVVIKEITE